MNGNPTGKILPKKNQRKIPFNLSIQKREKSVFGIFETSKLQSFPLQLQHLLKFKILVWFRAAWDQKLSSE